MIHNEHIDLTTTEPDPPNINRSLGVEKLKLFAGIHIGIGVACMIACTVGLIANMNRKDACCYDNSCDDDYNYSYDPDYSPNRKCIGHRTIMILYVTCLCLSLWYLLTGMIPLCMTDSRKQRWKCLKITFLVFNIISAVVFSPAMLSIGILSIFIITLENNGDIITVSAIIDACAVIEMIVAITSATYCCCCSQMLPGNQQNVVIFNPVQERVVHTVTQLQAQPVNQYGILMPQGYPPQNSMPNTHVQIVTQQSPSQVLSPLMQGQQIQHHNGLANVNLNQQPAYLQPKLGQQPNQGVESQQQI
ncbi:uncharacterized protein [Mytilus edulis]|uniref:uncharacterized protein n=1 Tax=Mytilus edulis TaxID=6550 RepID=UPI0039EE79F0